MAGILTNQNESAISDISLLATQPGKFMLAHKEWFIGMDWYDLDWFNKYIHESMRDTFAYWLAGYEAVEDAAQNPKLQFGAFIDWKEAPKDIIWLLSRAARNLSYAAELEQMAFDGDESTDKALSKISDYLTGKGYVLLSLDTDSDCYHLFIVQAKDHDRLVQLAAEANFKFIRPLFV
jgi:hypothetical protein